MTHQVVHFKNGLVFVINMEVYENAKRFDGQPNTFLRFVESIGEWDRIEKTE